jgi:hypothetical protein
MALWSDVEPAGQRSRQSHDHWSGAVVDSVDQRPFERGVHALQREGVFRSLRNSRTHIPQATRMLITTGSK